MTDEAFSRLAESVREQIRAEEREEIAAWLEHMHEVWPGGIVEVAAREIRDGAHHEEER